MVRCFAGGEASNHGRERDPVLCGPFEARVPRAPQGEDRTREHHSAGTSGLTSMRLFSRSRSSHSSCQPEGRFDSVTCTAVTLYSGQLVAQSEYSVVMTLVPVTGWWN